MNTKKHSVQNETAWLSTLTHHYNQDEIKLMQKALALYPPTANALRNKGLSLAQLLLKLDVDSETLTAAILYPAEQQGLFATISLIDVVGEAIAKLVHDVMHMQTLDQLRIQKTKNTQQIEILRKVLLAMVKDIRAILIILAERILQLHAIKNNASTAQQQLAEETAALYAPLANRLGIGQFKWELEDLCFRYLEPLQYAKIAQQLAEKRQTRETYLHQITQSINHTLQQASMKNYKIMGRVKHIYSIYRKIQKKNADFDSLYDVQALRILVETVDECYQTLSILSNTYEQLPNEFDDYIAHPKPNGYQSIHLVIMGPQYKNVEIQIRTFSMHHASELGVAAHWRYKEDIAQTSHYEAKIALLRQLMAWQHDVYDHEAPHPHTQAHTTHQDLFQDRVYVFTPLSDVIELPKGATPLDFAYYVHSEMGHRCRGAKINGAIMPLTHPLQTGDRVEILTSKTPRPSRDWLNTQLGYLKTTRARAKVLHWFRMMTPAIATTPQPIQHEHKQHEKRAPATKPAAAANKTPTVQILGVNRLVTNIARCCRPQPYDDIIGYITRMRGIRIHKKSCRYVGGLHREEKSRLIEVSWD